jgi:hypothetical protein
LIETCPQLKLLFLNGLYLNDYDQLLSYLEVSKHKFPQLRYVDLIPYNLKDESFNPLIQRLQGLGYRKVPAKL